MDKILLMVAMAGLLVSCSKTSEQEKPVSSEAPAVTNASAKATASSSEYEALKGKWVRTDGDYMLEIKSVEPDGKLDAGYYNPNPIHISKALLIKESGGTKVFIELQDEGYPGCTYSLSFDAATSQLHGQYFQAAMQQTYDVVFAKLKE